MTNYTITKDDILEFAETGGELSILNKKELQLIPMEDKIKYISNGGKITILEQDDIRKLSPYIINQNVINGGDLYDLMDYQFNAIPQEVINQRAKNGFELNRFKSQRPNTIEALPREITIQFINNGGSYQDITSKQIKKLPAKTRNSYIARAGDVSQSPRPLFKRTPQKFINQYIANAGAASMVPQNRLNRVPQQFINKRAFNGGDLGFFFLDKKLHAIPDEDLYYNAIKQHFLYNLSNCTEKCVKEKLELNPDIETKTKELFYMSSSKKALILYHINKIKSDELPVSVFFNLNARNILLKTLKLKVEQEFLKICNKYHYDEDVPEELKTAFNEKLSQIEKWVENKRLEELLKLFDYDESSIMQNIATKTTKETATEEVGRIIW